MLTSQFNEKFWESTLMRWILLLSSNPPVLVSRMQICLQEVAGGPQKHFFPAHLSLGPHFPLEQLAPQKMAAGRKILVGICFRPGIASALWCNYQLFLSVPYELAQVLEELFEISRVSPKMFHPVFYQSIASSELNPLHYQAPVGLEANFFDGFLATGFCAFALNRQKNQ